MAKRTKRIQRIGKSRIELTPTGDTVTLVVIQHQEHHFSNIATLKLTYTELVQHAIDVATVIDAMTNQEPQP